jgi:hypothetical protein
VNFESKKNLSDDKSMNRSYGNYANYANVGQSGAQPVTGSNDPLTYCLVDTMDKQFQHGSIANLYGPRSQNCQLYMADRCAAKWDGFCEYYYRVHGSNDGQWPNNQYWPDTVQPSRADGVNVPLPLGRQLLRNAGERRFCEFPTCDEKTELFNPLDPHGPRIRYFVPRNGSGGSCIPVCRVNPATIDADPLMDRMMQDIPASGSTLINICNTAKREGTNLSGTRLGDLCARYYVNKRLDR